MVPVSSPYCTMRSTVGNSCAATATSFVLCLKSSAAKPKTGPRYSNNGYNLSQAEARSAVPNPPTPRSSTCCCSGLKASKRSCSGSCPSDDRMVCHLAVEIGFLLLLLQQHRAPTVKHAERAIPADFEELTEAATVYQNCREDACDVARRCKSESHRQARQFAEPGRRIRSFQTLQVRFRWTRGPSCVQLGLLRLVRTFPVRLESVRRW
mmetsp:Transcript_6436/g.40221  ORF Transcript_6436/g.40221 Transcript_6436/m.40221 type:complete len:209 (+) Transcript_6436:707-1333(+)